MPANKKYLTQSGWQKGAKLSAGILGGMLISALFHMDLALLFPNHLQLLITSTFSFFLIWCFLLILPYLFKNGFVVWAIYLLISIVLFILYYFANQNNPFV